MKKIIIILVIFFFDRITKIYLINLQADGTDIDFYIYSFLNFYLVWNTGIGFGLASMETNIYYHVLTAIIVIVNIGLIFFLIKSKGIYAYLIALIIGGSLGKAGQVVRNHPDVMGARHHLSIVPDVAVGGAVVVAPVEGHGGQFAALVYGRLEGIVGGVGMTTGEHGGGEAPLLPEVAFHLETLLFRDNSIEGEELGYLALGFLGISSGDSSPNVEGLSFFRASVAFAAKRASRRFSNCRRRSLILLPAD